MSPLAAGSPLIGRDDVLAQLRTALGLSAPDATRSAVLLGGDAGVGKTRLVEEVRAEATSAGWRVLIGHCVELTGGSLPYLPFTEALSRLAADEPEVADRLVERHPALARLLPEWAPAAPATPVAAAPGAPREELFAAVWSALDELARSAPLLLVVEDVHWADMSTRELLGFLLTRVSWARVSLVVTYRTDDLHRRHPLRTEVPRWARLPGTIRLSLRPLATPDLRRLVRQLLPDDLDDLGDLDDTVVDHITRRAEGNPFYAEELVAAARWGERNLSGDLVDLLLLRLDQLHEETRTVLRAMAVGGRRTSHALLAAIAGDGPELDAAVRQALDHHILEPSEPDGYAFRHALLAEAVYADLLPGERVRWHRAYAEVLRDRTGPGVAGELARHARAAGDGEIAVAASTAAGDEAAAVGAPAEAARHYEDALQVLAEQGAGASATSRHVDLVLRASDSAVAAGLLHRAIALLEDQLAHLPPDLDERRHVLLLLALAGAALMLDAHIDAVALTSEALRLPSACERSELRARLLAAHARACVSRGRREEGVRWATEAVALARELALPAVLADATTTLARIDTALPDEAAVSALRTSIAETRAAGDAGGELRSTHNLGSVLYEAGRLDEAEEAYARAASRAAELRRPWAPYGVDGRVMAALVAYARGDWDAALRAADWGDEQPPPLARAVLEATTLPVLAGRGDRHGLDVLARLRPWWERDTIAAITCATAGIDLHGDAGDLVAAEAVHDELVAVLGAFWGGPVFGARSRLSALLLGQWATAAPAATREDRRRRLDRAPDLVAAGNEAIGDAARSGPEGRAWVARVRAEELRLRYRTEGGDGAAREELVAAWEATCAAFETFGHVFELARSRVRLAEALRAAGRAQDAGAVLLLAEPVARRLGAEPLLRELAALGVPTGPTPRLDAADAEHLTARELEVLGLVAQGRTNREVGEALWISAKTVSVHLSNAMAKLHATSRTEAVFVAQRHGLLPVPSAGHDS